MLPKGFPSAETSFPSCLSSSSSPLLFIKARAIFVPLSLYMPPWWWWWWCGEGGGCYSQRSVPRWMNRGKLPSLLLTYLERIERIEFAPPCFAPIVLVWSTYDRDSIVQLNSAVHAVAWFKYKGVSFCAMEMQNTTTNR